MQSLPWEIDEASLLRISLTITIASAAVVPCRSIVSLFPLLDLEWRLNGVTLRSKEYAALTSCQGPSLWHHSAPPGEQFLGIL